MLNRPAGRSGVNIMVQVLFRVCVMDDVLSCREMVSTHHIATRHAT